MGGLDTGYGLQQAQQATEQQTRTPDQMLSACGSVSGGELVGCIASQIETQGQTKHDAEDLVAQQQSAHWAIVAALAGAGGLVSTIIGLFFVWQSLTKTNESLRLNRQANDHARESAERQLRAYVSIKDIVVNKFAANEAVEVSVLLINSGQTPARELRGVVSGIPTPTPYELKAFPLKGKGFEGKPSQAEVGAGGGHTLPLIGPRLTAAFYAAAKERKGFIVVAGYGSYRDVFKKRHLFVFRGHIVVHPDGHTSGVTPHHKSNGGN